MLEQPTIAPVTIALGFIAPMYFNQIIGAAVATWLGFHTRPALVSNLRCNRAHFRITTTSDFGLKG